MHDDVSSVQNNAGDFCYKAQLLAGCISPSGSRTVNVVPAASVEATWMSPPCARAISQAIYKTKFVPAHARLQAGKCVFEPSTSISQVLCIFSVARR